MRYRLWLFGGAACVAGVFLFSRTPSNPPPSSPAPEASVAAAVPTTEAALPSAPPPVDTTAPHEEPKAEQVHAAHRAPEPPAATLNVTIDGRPTSWTTEDLRSIRHAGGTHDIRELTAALAGGIRATVQIVGQTETGERTATVNLEALAATDQLRIWPESDGTWSISRNVTSEDGRSTVEQYSLTDVKDLAIRRN
ncbi:hypothetical protein LZC95_38645 [Pendulispora brunnea]|uniref:Uncharacterized protein n=1 Tax=Pendulispora brunnea TaxID=2905690 RepID=A0ABZ2K4T3_9BACT